MKSRTETKLLQADLSGERRFFFLPVPLNVPDKPEDMILGRDVLSTVLAEKHSITSKAVRDSGRYARGPGSRCHTGTKKTWTHFCIFVSPVYNKAFYPGRSVHLLYVKICLIPPLPPSPPGVFPGGSDCAHALLCVYCQPCHLSAVVSRYSVRPPAVCAKMPKMHTHRLRVASALNQNGSADQHTVHFCRCREHALAPCHSNLIQH